MFCCFRKRKLSMNSRRYSVTTDDGFRTDRVFTISSAESQTESSTLPFLAYFYAPKSRDEALVAEYLEHMHRHHREFFDLKEHTSKMVQTSVQDLSKAGPIIQTGTAHFHINEPLNVTTGEGSTINYNYVSSDSLNSEPGETNAIQSRRQTQI